MSGVDPFDFRPRTRLVFGEGALSRLGEVTRELGVHKALLVSDPGVVVAGHAGRALEELARAGVASRLFDGVIENPTDRCVAAGLAAARELGADHLVAVGGGSAMDCAKGIALLHWCGGSLKDYRGMGKVPSPLPSLIAVPTTAGTGSEVQSAALIADAETHEKMVIWDHKLAPAVAILDPALTLTLPPGVAAATGLDAISHAVESAACTKATELSRMFARSAYRLLLPALPRVLAERSDVRARSGMLLGAAWAGLSIEHSMLGAAHALSNPLTSRYGIIHGVAVSLVLPHVVRFNGINAAAEEHYQDLERAAGGQGSPGAANRIADQIEALADQGRLPRRLRDAGVEESALEAMAGEAAAQWTASFNPRPAPAAELYQLYRTAF